MATLRVDAAATPYADCCHAAIAAARLSPLRAHAAMLLTPDAILLMAAISFRFCCYAAALHY